jgi:hypothetical protein
VTTPVDANAIGDLLPVDEPAAKGDEPAGEVGPVQPGPVRDEEFGSFEAVAARAWWRSARARNAYQPGKLSGWCR